MRLSSLRSKIFSFVVAILVMGAGLVMLVIQHNVTHTVTTSEERAVDNILTLLARDSVARWGSLLGEKAATARQARQPLIHYSSLILSTLGVYTQQEQETPCGPVHGQLQALQWLSSLSLGENRHAYIMDSKFQVIADSRNELRGSLLGERLDIKGRTLADIAREELTADSSSFIIYRIDSDKYAGSKTELRYATLARFPAWDWFIVVSDSAQRMVDEFQLQRTSMEKAVAETVAAIRLAGSGFAFIIDEDNKAVTPLPEQYAYFLNASAKESPETTLTDLLNTISPSSSVSRFEFSPQQAQTSTQESQWIIKAAYVKPLKWTVVAAVPSSELARPATELRNRIGILFLAGLIAALGLAWVLSKRITGPLVQLGDFARHLPERDLTLDGPLPAHIEQIPLHHKDEVGDLATAFIHMDEQLRDKIAHLLHETSRRERYESELTIARDIQMGLLPVDLSSQVLDQIELHATMIPAKEVGGDFYDYFVLSDGRLCLAIGDVSDKGVPAALFMAVTRTLLRASAEYETDPAKMMERINTRLADNNPNMMFVTLMIAVLDMGDGTLEWANGGHPPPCILQADGHVRELNGRSGPACGVQPGLQYRRFVTILHYGETLFGYTDGIPEAMNSSNHQYSEAKMLAQLRQLGSKNLPAYTFATAIIDDVRDFAEDNEQSDDITLIIAKRVLS